MPRPLRLQDAGFLHHVITKGNDQQALFISQEDYLKYLDFLTEARTKYPLKIYNYCLLNNHLHLLVKPIEEGSLSKAMEHISKSYAKYFNKKYDRTGHVFQGRFKSFLVQEEKFYFSCSRYIDLSPVKENLVMNSEQYAWSGYKTLAKGEEGNLLLDIHELYNNLGANALERQIAYRTLVLNYQGEELDLLERRAGILGDRDYKNTFKASE